MYFPFFQQGRHWARRLALLMLILSLWTTEAWAQLPQKPPPADKNYAASYFLVGLFIILGFLLVLRPSGRNRDFRPPTPE